MGMGFANLVDPGNGMVTAWAILFGEWFLFMAGAWYLEQVFASGTGNRRHPLFFLDFLRKVGPPRGLRPNVVQAPFWGVCESPQWVLACLPAGVMHASPP